MQKIFLFCLALFAIHCLQAQHTVVLKSGDKVKGVVLSLQNDVLEVVVEGKSKEFPMRNVSSIFFNEYVPYDGVFIADGKETTLQVGEFTVKYNVKDRKMIKKPVVSIGTEDKGTVVVSITVDRAGNIRSAKAGAPGSTTSSNYLYVKATAAAKSAKFDENPRGPLITEGTITIVY